MYFVCLAWGVLGSHSWMLLFLFCCMLPAFNSTHKLVLSVSAAGLGIQKRSVSGRNDGSMNRSAYFRYSKSSLSFHMKILLFLRGPQRPLFSPHADWPQYPQKVTWCVWTERFPFHTFKRLHGIVKSSLLRKRSEMLTHCCCVSILSRDFVHKWGAGGGLFLSQMGTQIVQYGPLGCKTGIALQGTLQSATETHWGWGTCKSTP